MHTQGAMSNAREISAKSIVGPWSKLKSAYNTKTPTIVKAVDAYLLFCLFLSLLQLVYCVATKGLYYHQFLGALFATAGSFVMAGKSSETASID